MNPGRRLMHRRAKAFLPGLLGVFLAWFPAYAAVRGFVELEPGVFLGVGAPVLIQISVSGVSIAVVPDPAPGLDEGRRDEEPGAEAYPAALAWPFEGSVDVSGDGSQSTRVSFFRGNDPDNWRVDRMSYARVVVTQSGRPDLVFAQSDGAVTVHPASELDRILASHMPDELAAEDGGGFAGTIHCKGGGITIQRQDGAYSLRRESSPPDDPAEPRFRDTPHDWWATYLGGPGIDHGHSVRYAADGNILVCGASFGGFPVTPGAYSTSWGGYLDGVVAKLSGDGTALIWATYVGGEYSDRVRDFRVCPDGDLVLVGFSSSTDFPTTPGSYSPTIAGQSDGVVLKLRGDGSAIVWSTFLGGTRSDYLSGVVLADNGDPIVVGSSESPDFPMLPGSWDPTFNGMVDGVFARLSSDGRALIWSTYLGGSGWDFGHTPRIDRLSSELVVSANRTGSPNFPVTAGVFGPAAADTWNGAVAALRAADGQVAWTCLIGGTEHDFIRAFAPNGNGDVLVAGVTASFDFPVTHGAFQTVKGGYADGFAACISDGGTRLAWCSYVGGYWNDYVLGLAVGSGNEVVLTGTTYSEDFPISSDAFQSTTIYLDADAFVSVLSPDGSSLIYGTFYGELGPEGGVSVALGPAGNVCTLIESSSDASPMSPGTYNPTYSGSGDLVLFSIGLNFPTTVPEWTSGQRALAIYPNPSTGPFRAEIPAGRGEVAGYIYDVQGRLVGRVGEGKEGGLLDVLWVDAMSARPHAGAYFIELRRGDSEVYRGRLTFLRQ